MMPSIIDTDNVENNVINTLLTTLGSVAAIERMFQCSEGEGGKELASEYNQSEYDLVLHLLGAEPIVSVQEVTTINI